MTVLDYRSGLEDFDTSRSRAGSWVSWAVYLGMSWTWCIGMYLPVILVRDYGFWAWVIFAIPNVIGAAAMGWVLKDRDSEAMVAAHGRAIKAFSLVTVAFQIFFAFWMFDQMDIFGASLTTLIFAVVILRASRREADVQSLASVVFMASLVTMLFEAAQGSLGRPFPVPLKGGTILDLIALAPVCFFGFLLCPYLDTTFHRARQHLPKPQARAAFLLGFGFFFFVMILYSLLYARQFADGVGRYSSAGVIGHWIFQLGFTIGVHWAGLPRQGERLPRAVVWGRIAITIAIAAVAWIITVPGQHPLPGEVIYRLFMGFYGLFFPAYVWLCMIPGRGRRAPTRQQLTVCGITVLIALPMFWLGFVEKWMVWLLPGIVVVLAARWFIKPLPKDETFDSLADNPLYERNPG